MKSTGSMLSSARRRPRKAAVFAENPAGKPAAPGRRPLRSRPTTSKRSRAGSPTAPRDKEIAFMPARVLLQDFTGVPAVVDLAAMRDAMRTHGRRPQENQSAASRRPGDRPFRAGGPIRLATWPSPSTPNSNSSATSSATASSAGDKRAFQNFQVVPPDTGIVHQVNLEYLARVVFDARRRTARPLAYPDSLVGTDSHTTMINGLGVFGWGVGGIEAEAAMLGQPLSMLIPDVVGFKLHGRLPEGATATDLVLTVTEMLRKKGVVGKFVEFYGTGLSSLSLPDRATIANMAPEYGATMGFFPVDAETLAYLRFTGRDASASPGRSLHARSRACSAPTQTPDPIFTDTLELDLASVEPTLAGPKRPQDRVPLRQAKASFAKSLRQARRRSTSQCKNNGDRFELAERLGRDRRHHQLHQHVQSVADARRRPAGEESRRARPHVEALGEDQPRAGLQSRHRLPRTRRADCLSRNSCASIWSATAAPPASATAARCPNAIGDAIKDNSLVAVSVLSGNRNFEGRINPLVPRQLSRLAAAGRRLRARRPHGFRHRQRAARQRQRRQARLPARHLAHAAGSRRHRARRRDDRDVPQGIRRRFHGRSALARAARSRRRSLRVGREIHLHQAPAVLRRHAAARPPRLATFTARASWPCSATASPPTTSRPPARSSRIAPPANT